MKDFKLIYSKQFFKHYKKLSASEQNQTNKKLLIFEQDQFHPSLRTKKIKGQTGLWESSVNMDIRIIWYYDGTSVIALIDIGHHDILNKF